ncbi:MAG TPA: hypothetical protein VJ816_08215 [Gemmatimonadales bacterium]|nr:hypothetical protein [Gemmatimonadales bacterium]
MRFLRTNTAVIVAVGPFFDKTDGVTLETALTITNERITLIAETDDGSAPTLILDNVTGATSGTANDLNYITNNDAGMMQLELAAADTNRLGRMFLTITDAANHAPVFHEFTVLPAMIYDAFILGTDVLQADMTQILGTAVATPATAGILDANVKNINNVAAATPGAAGGVFIAGTNAATTITTGLTTTFTGNLTGSVGSVTGAVGSVTGLTASDVGAIKTKTDFLPSATAGAAGGVFIAGTNAATTVTTALTANITGNLSGSVGSVTGAVGSVTGAVGSVTGLTAATVHSDLDDIQARLPAALVSGRMDASVGAMAANVVTAAALAADAGAEIADAVWDEATAGHATAGSTGKALTDAGGAGTPPTAAELADAVWDETRAGHTTAGTFGEGVASVQGNVTGSVASVTGLTLAQIKAQLVAALDTDLYSESSAVPAASATLADKIVWLATLARNKITQTATTQTVRNDGDTGTVGTSTVSDDSTTFTRGKFS